MAIGAYSVVRFADSLRDERINLGIIVWHPYQGFSHIIPKALDRAKTINPWLDSDDVKRQMAFLKHELDSDGVDGVATLTKLSSTLREGFQVSVPYPTRLSGAKECADHLFHLLVAKFDRTDKAAEVELPIQQKLTSDLRSVSHQIDPRAIVQDMGERHIAQVRVNIGIRTFVHDRDYLWRMVSLNTRTDDQISRAKATAMDILKIKGLTEFDRYRQAVAVLTPAKTGGESFAEANRWLNDQADNVVAFRNPNEIPGLIAGVFQQAA
jgi:hypothetical protein